MKPTIPIQPFQDQGHYTEVHNLAFDYIMPRVSGSAWKVLSLIIRKTKGWGKKSDEIAYTKIKEGTGIKSDPTVSKALQQLLKMGCILKKAGASQFEGTRYALNRNFTVPPLESSTIENIVDESATEIKAALISVAAPATEIKAVSAIETKDTKATNQNESNSNWVGGCECAPAPTPPAPEKAVVSSVLHPPPESAEDVAALARECRVNVVHPDPRDVAKWSAAVETVRAALPDTTSADRGHAVAVFTARWKSGGKRGSPYLSNVINHFVRVMNDDENEESHGKNQQPGLQKRVPSASEQRGQERIDQLNDLARRREELETRKREMAERSGAGTSGREASTGA